VVFPNLPQWCTYVVEAGPGGAHPSLRRLAVIFIALSTSVQYVPEYQCAAQHRWDESSYLCVVEAWLTLIGVGKSATAPWRLVIN
jgi:hypothetical protein